MTGTQRRQAILQTISRSQAPCTATALAQEYGVSRQAIVQDIALLRAAGAAITATSRGYKLDRKPRYECTVCVFHTDQQILDELQAIVDAGACVEDVSVMHQVYGELCAPLGVDSRRKAQALLESIQTGQCSPLKNVTEGYHRHRISAESPEILQEVCQELQRRGYLLESSPIQ